MSKGFLLVSFGMLVACNGSVSASSPQDAGSEGSAASQDSGAADGGPADTGATDGGGEAAPAIGSACVPSLESDPSFDGFDAAEISLHRASTSSSEGCLVYHFQGLVTCPYGQSATGQAPAGASPCKTTGGDPVTGSVAAQCTDRRPPDTVIWSCRCANTQGLTNDGYDYCTCPSGMACTQAITSIGAAEDDLSGAYCLPPAAVGDGGPRCAVTCDPATAACP